MLIQRYSICLILFFNFHELFLPFICAINTGSLVNSLFGVKIFTPFSLFTSSSTLPYGGISDKSIDSSLSLFLEVCIM